MNLFQLVFKQMRQRALSSTLTILSVLLGVAMAIAVLVVRREADHLFVQSDFGYDIILGPSRGSELLLVFNTAYHMSSSPGNVPYTYYEQFPKQLPRGVQGIKWKVPFLVGDNYSGLRIVGTPSTTFLPSLTTLEKGINDLSEAIDGKTKPTGADAAAQMRTFAKEMSQIAKDRVLYDADACAKISAAAAALDKAANGAPSAPLSESDVPPLFGALENARESLRSFSMFGPMEYRINQPFELAEGRVFYPRRFEAIIGSEAAKLSGLKIGSKFKAEHGLEHRTTDADEHDEQWQVVGILKPTHTANDKVIFVSLISLYAIPEHEAGMEDQSKLNAGQKPTPPPAPSTQPHHDHEEPYELDKDGNIELKLTKDKWLVSAILVKSRGVLGMGIIANVNRLRSSEVQAVNPATQMREFFGTFLKGTTLMLLGITILISILAAISILVSIYNSIAARSREIAIYRALGATRVRVLTLVCVEAGLLGLIGGVLGLFTGHALAGVGSALTRHYLGQSFNYLRLDQYELLYLAGVVVLAVLAGFVPAMKAYRTPVAANLVAA